MKQLKSTKIQKELIRKSLDESVSMILGIDESFTRKIRSKKNDELTAKADTAFVPDGVYILHETLGVKSVDGWNPKNNDGVVGILLIEDDHKIVVALEDSPKNLHWSKKNKLVNAPIGNFKDAESDFNGENHCINLNSPDFPAAYYCKTYNKGGRSWYLPSSGELRLIYNHLDEIQNALSIVGGQKLVTTWDEGVPVYWSSTERSTVDAWYLRLSFGTLSGWGDKVSGIGMVRPVSKFDFSTLKESFTRKIRSKKNNELTAKPSFELDNGVYILHETLGVKGVEGWNPKNNDGVIGILLIEDDHKIVVALEDSPKNLHWSKKRGLINQPVDESEKSDFSGEYYCQKLDSPDFPAAYYCKTYNKGGRNWYLPSTGELWLIYNHLKEVQNALETVGGQKLITTWDEGVPVYWSSTENSATDAWYLDLNYGYLNHWLDKASNSNKVRPVSKFDFSTLKESFTRKISSKKNNELTAKADTAFVPDGVYILHEILGVRTVDSWNPKNNDGVVGVLLIEDDHKIVVALEDSPEDLPWSKKRGLINQPVVQLVDKLEDAESDFNGEYYCQKLDSPKFPAAYYCKTYNKGGRSWYLPSSGELWLICRHLEEIQNALETVGGKKFATEWDNGVPCYWSSTEYNYTRAWYLDLNYGYFDNWYDRVSTSIKVRPVSAFSV